MKTIVLLIIGFLIFNTSVVFAQESQTTEQYQEMAWHQYQAGRICFEKHDGEGMLPGFEECLKIQNACKLIYDGISSDERRRWLLDGKVKEYILERALKPLDYLHILNLISQEQSIPKE